MQHRAPGSGSKKLQFLEKDSPTFTLTPVFYVTNTYLFSTSFENSNFSSLKILPIIFPTRQIINMIVFNGYTHMFVFAAAEYWLYDSLMTVTLFHCKPQ